MTEPIQNEVSLSTTVAGQQFLMHGPTGIIVIILLLIGWFGFAWIIYDNQKQIGHQHDTLSLANSVVIARENEERKREHEEMTRQLAVLTCVIALPEARRDTMSFERCILQWKRAVLMLPG